MLVQQIWNLRHAILHENLYTDASSATSNPPQSFGCKNTKRVSSRIQDNGWLYTINKETYMNMLTQNNTT